MNDEQIFRKAIELPMGARSQYLEATCADSLKRLRVEKLIEAHEAPDSLLADSEQITTTMDSGRIDAAISIGPYKLREQIGEGGMGVVYIDEASDQASRTHIANKAFTEVFDSHEHAYGKFLSYVVGTTAVLLPSYHFHVRPTWIGWLLNGKMVPIFDRGPRELVPNLGPTKSEAA